jgi:hypothetical protein
VSWADRRVEFEVRDGQDRIPLSRFDCPLEPSDDRGIERIGESACERSAPRLNEMTVFSGGRAESLEEH